jgi:tRNA pseudouridine38-40 synthase
MPQRYFIKLSFDGGLYHGWQQQKNALSVEQRINDVLNTILRQEVKITGCGRTDAGVHAKEFYAHFDTEKHIEAGESLVYNLNSLLPDDIVIDQIFKVKPEAHARFSAVKRTYQYFINSKRNPFTKNYEYFFFHKLDTGLMNEACNILMEHKDFSCFSKTHTQVNNFFCTIYEARWETQDSRYIFTIIANRFLRNMVRAIVGTMLDVGLHKTDLNEFRDIIEKGSRSGAGMSVAAQGLFLAKVDYPQAIFELYE